ncbi:MULTISPECIES: DUF397 domain-containing protein [unclassified Crossiella]|uniref:DUF397 domain-containing protein n=1 Tax=unclassified Crossiella TaxID=2620835 RepID=UPI001FFF8EBB|nr:MULTISPECIES: DUF397 domain-containing protein [unclassified Crossiella]MCK2244042.1 DUF397 domain-containing protein [Crossiella sp. S99.2]MCK2257100.1 DUF397 domain-containing protein [Crossiella sp. S99.1]
MHSYDPYAVSGTFAAGSWERPAICGPNGGHCVEVSLDQPGFVGLRDSKLDTSPVLVFDDQEWRSFLTAARAGQYDL